MKRSFSNLSNNSYLGIERGNQVEQLDRIARLEKWANMLLENVYISTMVKMAILLTLIISTASCSITGMAIGVQKDREKASINYLVAPQELNRIAKGNLLEIRTVNDKIIKGRFVGFEPYIYEPTIDLILIKRGKMLQKIRSSQIIEIEVIAEKRYSWILGLAIGALLDVATYSVIDYRMFDF